jgi:hypothetical protein
MSQPVIALWRCLLPGFLLGLVFTLTTAGLLILFLPFRQSLMFAPVGICFLFSWIRQNTWLFRLCRRVKHFETWAAGQVIFHYSPLVKGKVDLSVLRGICESALNEQGIVFGYRLRRKLVVYLFPCCREMSEVYGRQVGGLALIEANAILIPADDAIAESIPHEIAHLFAARLNPRASPLFSEGLAVWLQGSCGGVEIDLHARQFVQTKLTLESLRKPAVFFAQANQNTSYAWAGSFTKFLVRRFGWTKYRQYYRKSTDKPVKAFFKKFFGTSLEEAEYLWRRGLFGDRDTVKRNPPYRRLCA